MKTTKNLLSISIILGALLIAGLFLYLKKTKSEINISEMKPSQLNFTQTNHLSQPVPIAIEKPVEKKTEAPVESSETLLPKAQLLQAEDKAKWNILLSILKTKNDNDARMDVNFKKISPALREALYEKYNALPEEDRNGRGLIVFLIARSINTNEDIQFLKKVYQESPCLSLADCKTIGPDDPHFSSTNQTTLVYGQLAGLYSIDKQLSERPELLNDANFRSNITQVLIQAEGFAVLAVQEKARAIRKKFGL